VTLDVLVAPALPGLFHQLFELSQLLFHGGAIGPVLLGAWIHSGAENLHGRRG
jgi:hypothetical protein